MFFLVSSNRKPGKLFEPTGFSVVAEEGLELDLNLTLFNFSSQKAPVYAGLRVLQGSFITSFHVFLYSLKGKNKGKNISLVNFLCLGLRRLQMCDQAYIFEALPISNTLQKIHFHSGTNPEAEQEKTFYKIIIAQQIDYCNTCCFY